MITSDDLKRQPMGTRITNVSCRGFKKCADGAWYPIGSWRPYPLDIDDLSFFTTQDFDYQEVKTDE